jgi:hypothetical protein
LTVLIIAIVLRVPAVLFSRGYMASDDYFETIKIAYQWLHGGLWSSQGLLTWDIVPSGEIARFPLYNLILLFMLKLANAVGLNTLDGAMYLVRALHALLSLTAVWAVFRVIEFVTRSKGWAMLGGLIVAAQFAMPFLSVRNLIEVMSGYAWMLALLCLYRFDGRQRDSMLIYAGILTGLAWMFRFEIAFAVLPVPLALWWIYKEFRPALVYSAAVFAMILLSGIIDFILIGKFGGTSINHILQIFHEGPMYHTVPYIYLLIIILFFLPPFSLVAFYLAGKWSFWSKHLILATSLMSFIVFHTLGESRQERYMIPIILPLIVLLVLALEHSYKRDGWLFATRRRLYTVVAPSVVLNLFLLIPFTFDYGKRGIVEPLVQVNKMNPAGAVLIMSPEQGRLYPLAYAGREQPELRFVRTWPELADLNRSTKDPPIACAILYPPEPEDLGRYEDSLKLVASDMQEAARIAPSAVDRMLHLLNPGHNPRNEAWIFRRPIPVQAER